MKVKVGMKLEITEVVSTFKHQGCSFSKERNLQNDLVIKIQRQQKLFFRPLVPYGCGICVVSNKS